MVFGQSLCQLVTDAKGGNDEAFVRAIQVDRTVLQHPYFRLRLTRAQLSGDANFMDMLGYRIRNPLLRSKLKNPKLWLAFAILQDEGLLEDDKRPPLGELMDLCEKAGVYDKPDVNTFGKALARYLTEQRKRKDF